MHSGKGSEGSLTTGKGGTRRARGPEMKKGQASLPVSPSPLNLSDAFAQLSLVSDSQDGRFDNVTVDPTSPVSPTLWRRRRNPSGSKPDIMSAELPLINRNHPRREIARRLVTSATSFAASLKLARVVRR